MQTNTMERISNGGLYRPGGPSGRNPGKNEADNVAKNEHEQRFETDCVGSLPVPREPSERTVAVVVDLRVESGAPG